MKSDSQTTNLPCPICNGVDGCDHSRSERSDFAKLSKERLRMFAYWREHHEKMTEAEKNIHKGKLMTVCGKCINLWDNYDQFTNDSFQPIKRLVFGTNTNVGSYVFWIRIYFYF